MNIGACYDIKSSYPAIMMNYLPVRLMYEEQPIQEMPFNSDNCGVGFKFCNYFLYRVKFEFASECNFPCLTVKITNKPVKNLHKSAKAQIEEEVADIDYMSEQNQAQPEKYLLTDEEEIGAAGAALGNDIKILTPLRSERFHWLWGVELNEAIEAYDKLFKFECTHIIRYEAEKSHAGFVREMFDQRLKAQLKMKALQGDGNAQA